MTLRIRPHKHHHKRSSVNRSRKYAQFFSPLEDFHTVPLRGRARENTDVYLRGTKLAVQRRIMGAFRTHYRHEGPCQVLPTRAIPRHTLSITWYSWVAEAQLRLMG